MLHVRPADAVRTILVELVHVEASNVVRLEDRRVEHARDAIQRAHRAYSTAGPASFLHFRSWSASSQQCCSWTLWTPASLVTG